MVSIQPEVDTASLTKVTVGVPQASLAVTDAMLGAGTVALQPSARVAGQVMDGGVTSTVLVIVCVHTAVLPHGSVARYVLVVVSVQPARFTASLTKVTVGVPQASVAVTEVISAGGTVALQPSARIAGQVITGGVLSLVHVTVLIAVAELPQPSEAVKVLVCEAVQALVITGPSVNVTIGVLHAAVAVADPKAASIAAAEGLQPSVTEAGVIVIVGGLGALSHVTVLIAVAELPQPSTAVNVLV